MEVHKEDAELVFKKWASEAVELHCEFRGFSWVMSFFGRISSVSDESVTVTSLDGKSTLRLPFAGLGLIFGYGDTAGSSSFPVPGWSEFDFASCLIVILPSRSDTPTREALIFSHIPPAKL